MMKYNILEDLEGMTRTQFIALCRVQGSSYNYSTLYDFDKIKIGSVMKIYSPIGSNKADIILWFNKEDKLVNFTEN